MAAVGLGRWWPSSLVGPAIGLLLERALFRYLRGSGAMAKLVTSLGLLIAIPEIVRLLIGQDTKQNPPPLWWVRRTDEWLWPEGGRFVLDAGQVATIASTVVVVIGLVVLFGRTDLGLRMRAVVESARMAELHGVNSERVSMASWALSSLLAGLAGVLVAPLFASLNPIDLFTLLVAALAATVVGRAHQHPAHLRRGDRPRGAAGRARRQRSRPTACWPPASGPHCRSWCCSPCSLLRPGLREPGVSRPPGRGRPTAAHAGGPEPATGG